MIIFAFRSKAQGNRMSDAFNRMGIPSLVCSHNEILKNLHPRIQAIVVSVTEEVFNIYDFDYVVSLKFRAFGVPVFAYCSPEDKERTSKLYTFDEIFTNDLTPAELLREIQLFQYDHHLPRTGYYELGFIMASLNMKNPTYLAQEFKLSHNELMIVRLFAACYPSELTAKEILKNSFKKINCPSLGSVRTTICQMNKKFEAQFDDRIIYPTDDKRAYMHKILGFDPFTMFPLLMKRRY